VTDKPTISLDLKDVLVTIPAISSAFALSWEIGRFLPFGGFEYFSVSEHLLAAINGLPVAIVATAIAVACIFGIDNMWRVTGIHNQIKYFFPAMLGPIIPLVLEGFSSETTFSVVLFSVAFMIVIINSFVVRIPLTGPLVLFFLGVFGILFAMAVSIDQARASMVASFERQSTIFTTTGQMRGFIVMAGEHGLLVYDPGADQRIYLKMDNVEKIELPRPARFWH
jgi:hypothetical protein